MNSIKSFIFLLTAWIIGIIFIILFFEIVLKIFSKNSPWDATNKLNIIRNSEINYKLKDLYPSEKKEIKYIRNKFGLRDNCDKPKSIEILSIGGSTVDQRYLELEETFQFVLQNLISKKLNRKVCVSNAGVDGHSTFGHIESFNSWFPLIENLKPKIVLVYIGVNDANFIRMGPNIGYEAPNNESIKGLLKKMELAKTLLPLYRIIKDRFQNKGIKYAKHENKVYKNSEYEVDELNSLTIEKAKKNANLFKKRKIKLLQNIESQFGAVPVCITQPHKYVKKINGKKRGIKNVLGEGFSGLDFDYSLNLLNEIILDLCKEDKTIDLYNMTFDEKYFYDGIHTNPEGSNLIGRLIYKEILRKKIINKNF